jgi:hypothetical protein
MNTNRDPATVRQNILYAVMDDLCQPAMTITDAPVLRMILGVRDYGAWMLVNSITAPVSGLTLMLYGSPPQ